jgi:hypothetical protein
MKKGKYIAVVEVEIEATTPEKAVENAVLFCEAIRKNSPKLSEVYFESKQERELIFNE